MTVWIARTDSEVFAVLLGVVLLAVWAGAWVAGRRIRGGEMDEGVQQAGMALLGLLLGFAFSMSLSKHDTRRQMVVTDSNAIADFATCAGMLKEPHRGPLLGAVREYAEYRLSLSGRRLGREEVAAALARIEQMQGRMQEMVRGAVEAGTPVTVPLVQTFNGMTSAHAARVAALEDRMPGSIMAMLALTAVVTMVMGGWKQGIKGTRSLGSTVSFVGMVCLVVWVILDLNQPERGAITVDQEPMRRVVEGMK